MAVCDNPKCQYHLPKYNADPRYERVYSSRVLPNGEQEVVAVERHLYRSTFGREFFLCGPCHTAVEMVKGGAR